MPFSKVTLLIIGLCLLLSCKSEAKDPILEKPISAEVVDEIVNDINEAIINDKEEITDQEDVEPVEVNDTQTEIEEPVINNEPPALDPEEIKEEVNQTVEPTSTPIEGKDNGVIETSENSNSQGEAPLPDNDIEQTQAVQETPIVKEETVNTPLPGIHDALNNLLSKYVSSSGVVDYKGLKGHEPQLDGYLESLNPHVPKSSDTSKEAMAFWMNAYNAFTVKLILKNYPLSSIRDLDGGNPWDSKWIKLGGKTYSLNNIEHDILRPTFKDPRIHFAVNCAAKSCPKLGNTAFAAETLESQLETLTKSFVNNTMANSVTSGALELSKIFEWYVVDFGDLRQFIDKYSKVEVSPSASISYRDYNWSLNGK